LKSINKQVELEKFSGYIGDLPFDYREYYKVLINEKTVGKLGNECRFLVKLIDSFQIEVKKKAKYYKIILI
jgi:hypothetical protein